MPPTSIDHQRQRGDILIEAMIGALLVSVMFAALSYALSRTLVSQGYANAQSIALLDLRNDILQSKGINALCGGESPGSLRGNLSLSAQCTTADIADVGIAGQQITITGFVGRNFSLSTTSTSASQSRLGQDGVVIVDY